MQKAFSICMSIRTAQIRMAFWMKSGFSDKLEISWENKRGLILCHIQFRYLFSCTACWSIIGLVLWLPCFTQLFSRVEVVIGVGLWQYKDFKIIMRSNANSFLVPKICLEDLISYSLDLHCYSVCYESLKLYYLIWTFRKSNAIS